jgi:hypothetical protein
MERKLAIKWVLKNCKFAAGNPFAFDSTPPKRVAPVAPKPVPQAAPAQAPYSYKARATPTQAPTQAPTQTGDPNYDSKMQLWNLLKRVDAVPFAADQKEGVKTMVKNEFDRDPQAAEQAVIKHESYGLPGRIDAFVLHKLKIDREEWFHRKKNNPEKATQWAIAEGQRLGIQFQG